MMICACGVIEPDEDWLPVRNEDWKGLCETCFNAAWADLPDEDYSPTIFDHLRWDTEDEDLP